MWESLLLGAALSLGQAEATPAAFAQQTTVVVPEPTTITAPVLPPTPVPGTAEREAPESTAAADQWWLMRELQGSWPHAVLYDNRMAVYGWFEMSGTLSTTDVTNQPVVWNDRANEFLVQQAWVRLERTVVTSGTQETTFGFRSDWLAGSDYRFSLPRGLWNSQLLNSTGAQNLYGVDPIAFYGEMYVPTLFQGADFKLGRIWTPFGVESLEAVSTPLLSRSYAFNWCPPFTHMGLLGTFILNPVWTVQHGLVNGNDVFIDPAQEMRYIGTVKWTQPGGGRNVVTLGTSVGRGKMNTGDPFNPATVSLMTEPAGRNNINVFDLVWVHTFNAHWAYTLETIYGYQTGVPANVPGGIISEDVTSGTAHWGSIVNYLIYTYNAKLGAILRLEFFDDFEGQRTGFEGLYTEVTAGVQIKPYKGVWIRPEIRYDHNGYSRAFEGKHGILTAASDLVIRW